MFKKLIAFIKGAFNPAKSRKSLVNTTVRKELSGKGKNASRRRKKDVTRAKELPAEKKVNSPKPKKTERKPKQPNVQKKGTVSAPQPPPPMPELIEIEPAEGKTRFCDVDLAKEVLAGTQQLGFR